MPRSNRTLCVRWIFLSLGLLCLTGCKQASPGEISLENYKKNKEKFEAHLPQWSRFVGLAEETKFQEKPIGVIKGKAIFVERDVLPSLQNLAVVELHFKNENSELHERGLIANSPEEVGTIVFVHTMLDRNQQFAGQAAYTNYKFHLFVVDLATGNLICTTELKVDKWDPPSSVEGTGISNYPYEKLDKFIESLTARKN